MFESNSKRTSIVTLRGRRKGQSLVEFSLVALVLYLLLAVILEFGRAIWVSQAVQSAADVMAREIARTPLPPTNILDNGEQSSDVLHPQNAGIANIYNDTFLIIDITDQPADQTLFEYLDSLGVPIVNRMLAPVMTISRIGDRTYLRYPGAVIQRGDGSLTVQVPVVVARDSRGVETIAWRPVVEGMKQPDGNGVPQEMFSVASQARGVAALRVNYPFQAAAMTAFLVDPEVVNGGPKGNLNQPIIADDGSVVSINSPIGGGTPIATNSEGDYGGPNGGLYGLGGLGAFNSPQLANGFPVRPFRRVITAQAVARREVFGPAQ